jgi:peptidoglycan/LPS O-acetylase OafA/YrhL
MALAMMIIGTLFISIKTNENNEILQGYMSIFAFCFSTGVFVFFKYTSFDNIGEKVSHIISMLSKYSFCAYLIHPLVIELFDYTVGVEIFQIGTAISIPFMVLIIGIISFGISAIINHIPILNKYIT